MIIAILFTLILYSQLVGENFDYYDNTCPYLSALIYQEHSKRDPNSIYESADGSFKITVNRSLQSPWRYAAPTYQPPPKIVAPTIPNNFIDNIGALRPNLIDTTAGISWLSLKLSNKNSDSRHYFAEQLADYSNEAVFHKFRCYQYSGFRQYVNELDGFDDFVIGLGDQLRSDSQLRRVLHKRLSGSEYARVCTNLNEMQQRALQVRAGKRTAELHSQLEQRDFNANGIEFIKNRSNYTDFLYTCNQQQAMQLQHIACHTNNLGEFCKQNIEPLNNIADNSTVFTVMANNANKENFVDTSQTLLQVAQDFLALGKGVLKSCGHNLEMITNALLHPIDTLTEAGHLIGKIGLDIGKVACTCTKFNAAVEKLDPEMLSEARSEIDAACDQSYQLYKAVVQKYQDSSRAEVLEITGGLATDAMFMLYAPHMQSATTEYMFQKLGPVGKKIKQATGLVCAKGSKYFKTAEELELSIAGSNLKLATALEQDAQRVISAGKALKSAQSEYVKIPFSTKVKSILKTTKQEMLACEKQLQAKGMKFKDIYGDRLPAKLKDKTISFDGISHIRVPNVKEKRLKAGKARRRIVGLHYDPGKKLEAAGLYKLENCKNLTGGMYIADLHYGGIVKKKKTFFPADWDFRKLTEKITEACNNVTEIKNKSGGIVEITGKVSDGFKIRTRLSKRGKILTTYPFLEG